MSGHGGFNTIGSYSQPVDGWHEIRRNMSVGEANAPGGSGQPQDTGENAPVRTNPRLEASNALIRQLDILLARAAESATRGCGGRQLPPVILLARAAESATTGVDAEVLKKTAVMRLDEAINHAKKLKDKGCVVSGDEWFDRQKQREIAGKMQSEEAYKDLPGSNSSSGLKGKKKVFGYFTRLNDGYFRRDFMTAIAKPGWFNA